MIGKSAGTTLAAALLFSTAAQADPGFYFKLDSGWSFARDAHFREDNTATANCMLNTASGGCTDELNHLGSSFVAGIGIGYQVAPNLRVDLTYQRRGGFDLRGSDSAGTDFDPPLTSDAFIVSGFYDLPVQWGSFKPFVGLALGRTRNKLDPVRWNDPGAPGQSGTLPGGSNNDRVYQLTLGGTLSFGNNWSLDLGYRYSDFGEFKKAGGPELSGAAFTTDSQTGKLRANELLIGGRWAF
jgi:opacity protein-like surface antigen